MRYRQRSQCSVSRRVVARDFEQDAGDKGRRMSLVELVPIIVVILVLGTDIWVYTDARARAEQGDPVVFSVGSMQLDSPEVWAVVCLLLWVFAFPIYLSSRNHPA
jgi:hypothetical protein